jgi:hypothetical protein
MWYSYRLRPEAATAGMSRAVSRAISSSSSVGTTSARTVPGRLIRPPVSRPSAAFTVYHPMADADQATLIVSGRTRPGLG